jgi:hypothetical protein
VENGWKALLGFASYDEVDEGVGVHGCGIDYGSLRAAERDDRAGMKALDFAGDSQSKRITATDGAEAVEIEGAIGEVPGGVTGEIYLPPLVLFTAKALVVGAIQIDDFRCQTLTLEYSGEAQDTEGGVFGDHSDGFGFGDFRIVEIVSGGSADETDFHRHTSGRRSTQVFIRVHRRLTFLSNPLDFFGCVDDSDAYYDDARDCRGFSAQRGHKVVLKGIFQGVELFVVKSDIGNLYNYFLFVASHGLFLQREKNIMGFD